MIHWGDVGTDTGRSLDLLGNELPLVQPLEGRMVYGSSSTLYQPQSRRQRPFRGPGPLPRSSIPNDALWYRTPPTSPSTPFLAPAIGPDAASFLSNWRSRFGKRCNVGKEIMRRKFFENLNNPRFEHQPETLESQANSTDGVASSPTHRFPKVEHFSSKDDPVEIREIDLKPIENAATHHTDQFDAVNNTKAPRLVLRRGQPFEFDVTFSRQYDEEKENIEVVMEIGEFPCESHGTRMTLPLRNNAPCDSALGSSWWAKLTKTEFCSATISVHIGSNAIVGSWTMKLVTTLKSTNNSPDLLSAAQESANTIEYVYPVHNIYILFNPWCPDDQVYMGKEEDLNEYIMNDAGKIWRGSHSSPKATAWVFGQFEQVVLDACLLMLEACRLPLPARSSPIQMVRAISAIVNSPDEDGIMEGNWSGDYRGGVPPTEWTGSIEILRKYATKGRPVQYGQCWNFAGIVCTVCRCLGIPCRVVTNYSSAHDTSTSVTVDYHIDTEGRPVKHLNTDNVWTYHVWNDVWMDRPDLPNGYGGWQAIDSTPQEKSDGLYRCGPAPLMAIKNGQIGLGFDTAFVFAEVNADKCYWLHAGRGLRFVDRETDSVGRFISTRKPELKLAPGSEDRMIITDEYKLPEGTKAERMAVMTALFTAGSHATMAHTGGAEQPSDVECCLDLGEDVLMGNDFYVTLRLNNKSDAARTVNLSMRLDTIMFMGTNPKKVKVEKMAVMLPPGDEGSGQMAVRVGEYLHRLMDQSVFLISVMAHVKETGQLYITSDDVCLKMPDVGIKFDATPTVGKPLKVRFELSNPIPVQLTNCKFVIDGPGFTEPKEIPCPSVMPHGIAKVTTELRPYKAGEHALVVHFTSFQLSDIDGYITATILP